MANSVSSDPQTGFPIHLPALTSVRFFLALGVVLFHYQLYWTLPEDSVPIVHRGRLGVDVFFILSGFILSHVYLAKGSLPRYRDFILARVARIFPVHLTILAGLLIMLVSAKLIGVTINFDNFSAPNFIATLFLVQAWLPKADMANWNGPAWSLSAEWFAYVIFPIFGWIALSLRRWPWLIIILAVLLYAAFEAAYQNWFGLPLSTAQENLGIMLITPLFLYGMGLYFLGTVVRLGQLQAGLCALGASLIFVIAMQLRATDPVIIALAGPMLLTLGLLQKSGLPTFMSHRWLQLAGEASFALYLVHMPVLMVWRNVMSIIFDLDKGYAMGLGEIAVLLTLTLCVSAGVHLWIERPSRDYLRQRFLTRPQNPRA